jgi:hypothetical protein
MAHGTTKPPNHPEHNRVAGALQGASSGKIQGIGYSPTSFQHFIEREFVTTDTICAVLHATAPRSEENGEDEQQAAGGADWGIHGGRSLTNAVDEALALAARFSRA